MADDPDYTTGTVPLEVDPLTAPYVMPREVRRIDGGGFPTTAMLDWEQSKRSWMVKTTVDLQRKITTVEQETADAFARVQDDMIAVISDGEALASRVTAVEAGVGENAAAIISEQTARANGDSALASSISSLTATVSSNTAAITAEQTARANGDSALASSISSLSTTVGGHTASISSLMTSVNGLGVQYAVQGYVGGSYGGFVFTGVKRADGAGANYLLEITSNVVINGDLTINGTVSNPKLANAAATQIATASGDSTATVSINYRGTGKISVLAYYAGTPSVDRGGVPSITVSMDGSPIESIQNNYFVWIPSSGPPVFRLLQTTILTEVTPSVGMHNFTVTNGVGGGVRIWAFEGSK